MYDSMSKDQTIEYNLYIISKIREMISEGYDKLKSFPNIKHSKFKIYHELEEKFNNITDNLKKYELFNDELTYFLLISDEILYIIYLNCENASFGHCNFALELFDFFVEIWNAKIKLIKNFSDETKNRDMKYSNWTLKISPI